MVIGNHFEMRLTMKPVYDAPIRFGFSALKFLVSLVIVVSAAYGSESAGAQQESAAPNWIQQGSFEEGEVSFLLVATEDFYLRSEASMVLMGKIRDSINNQIDGIVGPGGYHFVDLDDHFLQHEIVDEEIVIEKTISDPESGKAVRRHVGYARLRFDQEFAELVNHQYQVNFKARRLQRTGLVGILALCWLAAAYGYLRVDHATRHFYSRRLQTLAIILCLVPLIIAVLVAVGWKLI